MSGRTLWFPESAPDVLEADCSGCGRRTMAAVAVGCGGPSRGGAGLRYVCPECTTDAVPLAVPEEFPAGRLRLRF